MMLVRPKILLHAVQYKEFKKSDLLGIHPLLLSLPSIVFAGRSSPSFFERPFRDGHLVGLVDNTLRTDCSHILTVHKYVRPRL